MPKRVEKGGVLKGTPRRAPAKKSSTASTKRAGVLPSRGGGGKVAKRKRAY